MSAQDPPPRPPPHGQQPRPPGAMPDGNYDIFIIPPHSAGSGFLYLPSLAVQRNSFLAGVACALLAVGLYTIVVPALRSWLDTIMASGGIGILLLLISVGVAAWAYGKTQGENNGGGAGGASAGARAGAHPNAGATPKPNYAPPPPRPDQNSGAKTGWEQAKEDTKKKTEARKKEEELKKKREEAQKAREAAEKASKEKAEADKWNQLRAREKERLEREKRERIAKEREEREGKTRSAHSSPNKPTQHSNYHKPTARSVEEEYSYRPYDSPKRPYAKTSATSISGLSESSYAPSHSTARTTPPPAQRGPYHATSDEKVHIRAVYLFSDSFPMKPIASLISGQGSVTDGLVLRITTEALFIDDDVRHVPQREWDIKAWAINLVEDGVTKNQAGQAVHVVRVSMRSTDNKKFVFVLDEKEAYKVALGLKKLKDGPQVRALRRGGIPEKEARGMLNTLGWI